MYRTTTNFRPDKVANGKGPALSLPLSTGGEAILITAGPPAAAVMLTGRSACNTFALAGSGSGLIFENIEFEVDMDSMFRPASVDQPIGALIMSDRGLEIITTRRDIDGFPEAHMTSIDTTPVAGADVAVGFAKWRVVQQVGQSRDELFAFVSTIKGDF